MSNMARLSLQSDSPGNNTIIFQPMSRPTKLLPILTNSMQAVKRAATERGRRIFDNLTVTEDIEEGATTAYEPIVLGDSLLSDIFVILYSEAVQCTSSHEVLISTHVERDGNFWQVTVSDKPKGVPRESHATSALNNRVSVLGASILRSIVEERYGGSLSIKYRVPSTVLELWLPRFPSRLVIVSSNGLYQGKKRNVGETNDIPGFRASIRVSMPSG